MQQQKFDPFKIVILGDTEVGKTSLLQKFVHGSFSNHVQSTQGVHFEQKDVILDDGQQINFKLWDTAGQERFRSINALYYKDAKIAILVYDITSKSSFQTLKFWLSELKQHGDKNVVLAIVGNKQDLVENAEVDYNEARKYAIDNKALFRETSCKQGSGVDELFKDLGYEVLKVQDNLKLKKQQQQQSKKLKTEQTQQPKKKEKGGCC